MKFWMLVFALFFILYTGISQEVPIKILSYKGTPEEMGTAFGKDEGARFKNLYDILMECNSMPEWYQKWVVMPKVTKMIQNASNESKVEIEAFAKAANVEVWKVWLANCFYDAISQRRGCRQVAAWGKKTNQGLLHGRNLDWNDWGNILKTNNVLLIREYPDGNQVATLTWPGLFGSLTGCNDQGMALGFNQLYTKSSWDGEPIFLLLTRVLRNANTLEQAIQIIQQSKRTVAGSIMISSTKEKKAIVIDVDSTHAWVRDPNFEFIFNDNTCYFDDQGKYSLEGYKSCPIYDLVYRTKEINVLGMQKILKHDDVMAKITILSVVFDLENNRMFVSCGKAKAATGPYKEITIFKK
jgi:ribosomal protein L30E